MGTCVDGGDPGAVAICSGQAPAASMCLLRCDDAPCPTGSACLAGVCAPSPAPRSELTINTERTFQTLEGFGAGLAANEQLIVDHPGKSDLFDSMFESSGFSMLRLANRFDSGDETALEAAEEIVAAATQRRGQPPSIFLYSDTPPQYLKENGSRLCGNADTNCTLRRNEVGEFDYAGYAEYWRASVAAYQTSGIAPDFISIQGNADWLPSGSEAEACRFQPQQGTATVELPDGSSVESEFAGYAEALAAVRAALDSVPPEKFAAPEVGSSPMVSPYAATLAPESFGALAFHLYGEVAIDGSRQHLERIGEIVAEMGRPAIQSEMEEDGLNTAVLVHHTLVTAGASAYLQREFVGTGEAGKHPLIAVDGDGHRLLPAYHALAHFARRTAPGWRRVEASTVSETLLTSAWTSPDASALTIVMINPEESSITVEVQLPDDWAPLLPSSEVTRTVFEGSERSSPLGSLPEGRGVELPGGSIVTIAIGVD